MKLPRLGLTLQARLRWKNKPALVIINIGGNDHERAKNWMNTPAFSAMYLAWDQTPSELIWPVKDCTCLIEWGEGPSIELVKSVYDCLILAGAESVKIISLTSEYDKPTLFLDKDSLEWIETDAGKREINSLEYHQTNRSDTCKSYDTN